MEDQDKDTQLKVLQDGYEDLAAKMRRFLNRLNQITNLKMSELTNVISEKQSRIEYLERQDKVKRLKIERLEFQADKRETQRRRRNQLREIRKRKAQDSMLQLPPLN